MKIKDIAQRAGVSTATVSNVINGNYQKVSQATVRKVHKIINEMGYNPSAAARSLASKKSNIIGVVIPYLGKDQVFSINAYTNQAVAQLERYVRRKGYYLMIRCVEQASEIIPIFSAWNVDGVIFLGAYPDEVKEIEKLMKTPTVYVDAYTEVGEIANVGINDYKGGFLMACHLVGKGHTNIALVTPPIDGPGVVQERYRGFCDALKERGVELPEDHIFITQTSSYCGTQTGINIGLSKKGFTAVAAMSDMTALGVMTGLRTCGLNVPDDVSVIGFDNLEAGQYVYPPLTTIGQDIEKKCEAAGDLLFRAIESKEKISANIVLDIELIERQSVKNIKPANSQKEVL